MPTIRVVIVGTSCSGKTTLAKAIAAKANIPHIELDVLYWKPGWVGTSEIDFHEKIKQAITASDSWVLSGNYNAAKGITLPIATDIVWLNYPLYKNLWWGVKRSLQRIVSNKEVFEGCKETFCLTFLSRKSILLWIWNTHSRRKAEFARLLTRKNYPAANIWIIKSSKDCERLFSRI